MTFYHQVKFDSLLIINTDVMMCKYSSPLWHKIALQLTAGIEKTCVFAVLLVIVCL